MQTAIAAHFAAWARRTSDERPGSRIQPCRKTKGRRLRHARGNIARRFRLDAGLLKEPEIPEPLDEAVLPGAERDAGAIRQAAAVSAIGVNVHLEAGNARFEKGGKKLVRPDGVHRVADTGAGKKGGRGVVGNRRLLPVAER